MSERMNPHVAAEDNYDGSYMHAPGLMNRHERRATWKTRTSRSTRMKLRQIKERRLREFARGER